MLDQAAFVGGWTSQFSNDACYSLVLHGYAKLCHSIWRQGTEAESSVACLDNCWLFCGKEARELKSRNRSSISGALCE